MVDSQTQDAEEWARVEKALESREWDFRSIGGIAAEVSMPPRRVKMLIEKNSGKVRPFISRDRRVVYALKSKPVTAREVFDSLVTFAGS